MKVNRRPDCLEKYGVPVDLIMVCIAAIILACAVMLGIEIVKDIFN